MVLLLLELLQEHLCEYARQYPIKAVEEQKTAMQMSLSLASGCRHHAAHLVASQGQTAMDFSNSILTASTVSR